MAASAFGQSQFAGGAISITDTNAQTSEVAVSGLVGTVERVTVSLNGVTHFYPDDLDIALVGVFAGAQTNIVRLMSDAGGQFDLGSIDLTFADSGAALPNESQISAGTYRSTDFDGGDGDTFFGGLPSGAVGSSFSVFNGQNPNGTWRLVVADDNVVDQGSIRSWTLNIWTTPVISQTNNAATTAEDTAVTVNFNVNDSDTALGSLSLRSIYNTNEVASVTFGGNSATTNRTATILPASNFNGTTVITNVVGDGLATNFIVLNLTVTPRNDAPRVALSTNAVSFGRGGISPLITATVSDVDADDAPATLSLTAVSSDNSIVDPVKNVLITGSGAAREVRITPNGAATGNATVTLTVGDDQDASSVATISVTITNVTQEVFANNAAIDIEGETTSVSTINVTGVNGPVGKVTVNLVNFNHPQPEDVTVLLVGSNNQEVVLMRDAGGSLDVADAWLRFDDAATTSLPDAGQIVTSTNDPTDYAGSAVNVSQFATPTAAPEGPYSASLSAFNGSVAQGAWRLFVVGESGSGSGEITGGWVLTISPAPFIPVIENQTAPEDQNIVVTVPITDEDNAVSTVTVSSNTGDVAASRSFANGVATITLDPAANWFGTARITVTATDETGFIATRQFDATWTSVNDNPTQSVIPKQITTAGEPVGPITFTIGDVEDAAADLDVTVTSNNPELLPTGSIILGGTGAERTITIFPSGARRNQADVTVVVRDTDGGSSTQTFDLTVNEAANPLFENLTSIEVRDNAAAVPYPSAIDVRNLLGSVAEVQVTLFGITHPNPDDLNVMLVGPTGTNVVLVSDVGGGTDKALNGVTLVFTESATQSLPDEEQIVSGIYRPTDAGGVNIYPAPTTGQAPVANATSLSAFDGSNANGEWKLFVFDDTAGPRGGIISSWQLSIRTRPVFGTVPTIVTTREDEAVSGIILPLGDSQPGVELTIGASVSGTPDVVRAVNFVREDNRLILTVTPEPNAFGTNQITITVTDPDGTTIAHTFDFVVTPDNDEPTVNIVAQTSTPAATPLTVPFTVSDPETAAAGITVTAETLTPTIIPQENIILGGSGENRTLTILPAGIVSDVTARIRLTVDDNTAGTDGVTETTIEIFISPNASFMNRSAITINSQDRATPYPSTINVEGVDGRVSGVTVILQGFSHGFPDDVDIVLRSPNGTNVYLMSDAGGGTSIADTNAVRLLFSSGAPAIPDNGPLVNGTFSPANYTGADGASDLPPGTSNAGVSLDSFTGDPNGDWQLFVFDDTFGEGGAIAGGWILIFETGPTINIAPELVEVTEDTASRPIELSYFDEDTHPTNLTFGVTITSPDPAHAGLITLSGISLTGSGNNGQLVVRPSTNRPAGTTPETNVVTVTVRDREGNSASDSVVIRVVPQNDAPVITTATNRITIGEDSTVAINYNITDVDTTLSITNLTVTSSNPALVPNDEDNLDISGTLPNVVLTVTPAENQPLPGTAGSTVLTLVMLQGGDQPVTNQITLTVTNINDRPNIVVATNVVDVPFAGTNAFAIRVTDIEDPSARNLTLRLVGSSNPSVVPVSNVVLGGSGTNRTVTVTALNVSGESDLTFEVSDGSLAEEVTVTVRVSASNAFVFTVTDPITIADNTTATPYPSANVVSGQRGPLSRIVVTLEGFGHQAPDDVDVLLVHRNSGRKAILMSDAGGSNAVSNIRLRFDQVARGTLPDDSPITAGTYRPSNFESGDVFPSAPAGTASDSLDTFIGLSDVNGSWDLYVVDDTANHTGQIAFGWTLLLETAPTIQSLSTMQTVANEDTTASLSFTVDSMTNLNDVDLTYAVTNPALLPLGNIAESRSGGNVTLTLTPVPNQFGTNFLTITATRPSGVAGVPNATTQVTVTNVFLPVNDLPVLSRVTPKTTTEGTPVEFDIQISDVDTAATNLWLQAFSSNTALVSDTNIQFVVSYARTNELRGLPSTSEIIRVRVQPNAFATGTGDITIRLSEGGDVSRSDSGTFAFTVLERNDPPTIDPIADLTVQSGTNATFSIRVQDPEASIIEVTAVSFDESLIRSEDIVITPESSIQTNRTVTITTQPGITNRADVGVQIVARDENGTGLSTTNFFTVRIRATREVLFTNTAAIRIRDNTTADPYPSTNQVTGLVGNISTISITLNGFAHTYPDDVDILLVAPSGQKLMLMSDAGGSTAVTNRTLRFELNSALPVIPNSSELVSGTYQPANHDASTTDNLDSPAPAGPYSEGLNAFRGINPEGTWTLYIEDDVASESGHITHGWVLGITTEPVITGLDNVTGPEDRVLTETFEVLEEAFADRSGFRWGVTSTNEAVIPAANVEVVESGRGAYTVVITPAANASGQSLITLTLTNEYNQVVSDSFLATITPVNDAPFILTEIPDTNIVAGGFITITNFNYGDVETDKKNLGFRVLSSNPSVIPAENVFVIGNDIQIVTTGNATGFAEITVIVEDEQGGTDTESFLVRVFEGPTALFASQGGATVNDFAVNNGRATPYPITNVVSGLSGDVATVTVTLANLSHPYPDDVDILLVGPNGQSVVLMSDAGAGGTTNTSLQNARITFQDGAQALPDNSGINPFGTYRPTDYETSSSEFPAPAPAGPYGTTLTGSFAGIDPNGEWYLYVRDDASPDAGSLGEWLLNITTTGPGIGFIPDVTLPEGGTTNVTLTITDPDTDAGDLVVTTEILGTPVISVTEGGEGFERTLTITARDEASGVNTINVTVSDLDGNTNQISFNVIVTEVNDLPVVAGLPTSTNTPANVTLRIPFTVNDAETAVENLTITAAVSDEAIGDVSVEGTGANRTLVFRPTGDLVSGETITVSVSDDENTTVSLIEIAVTERVGPTISGLGPVQGLEDTTVGIPFSIGTFSPETLVVAATAENTDLVSSVTVEGTGTSRTLRIALQPNASGSSEITVTVTDEFGTSTATFVLTVPNAPDDPILGPIADVSTLEDTPVDITLAVSDSDTAISDLTGSATFSNASVVSGVSFINDGTSIVARITPAADASGTSAMSITVRDAEGRTATRSFTLTVTPVDDIPDLGVIADVTVAEDSVVNVPLTVSDPDTATALLNFSAAAANSALVSSVTVDTTGGNPVLRIALVPSAIGSSLISVSVSDGTGATASSFTLNVTNVDEDAPVIADIGDQATSEDVPLVLTLDITDPDTDLNDLAIFGTTVGTNVVSSIDFTVTETNTVQMTVNLVPDATGVERVTISVSDGNSVARTSFDLTVGEGNELPVLGAISDQTTAEGVNVSIPLTVSDPDSPFASLQFSGSSSNTNLVQEVTFTTEGTSVTANVILVEDAFGTADVTITVADETNAVSRTFRVNVIDVQHDPVFGAIADQTTSAGRPLTVTLNVTDEDTALSNLAFFYTAESTNLVENVSFNVTGETVTMTITPVAGATGSEEITISVSDGASVIRQTFTLTVNEGGDVGEPATLAVSLSGGNLVIAVTGTAGAEYRIEGTADFETWTVVQTITIEGDGTNTVEVPASGDHRFFRVVSGQAAAE